MNQKKQRTLAIFALAIALVATTVAYAALQTTLQVSGNVTKKGGTWAINIQNISSVTTTGSAKMTTKPSVSGTALSFDAQLTKPGDTISFTFDIANTGSVDAIMQIRDIVMNINNKNSFLATAGEPMVVTSDYVEYKLQVKNNYSGTYDDYFHGTSYTLASGKNVTLKLTLTFKEKSGLWPDDITSDKTLKINASFPFTQV